MNITEYGSKIYDCMTAESDIKPIGINIKSIDTGIKDFPLFAKVLDILDKYNGLDLNEDISNSMDLDVMRVVEDYIKDTIKLVEEENKIYLLDKFTIDILCVICALPVIYTSMHMVEPYTAIYKDKEVFIVVFRKSEDKDTYHYGYSAQFFDTDHYNDIDINDLAKYLIDTGITKNQQGDGK